MHTAADVKSTEKNNSEALIKVATLGLEGSALDYAVAKAGNRESPSIAEKFLGEQYYRPSTDWAHGGPIIESERLQVWPHGVPLSGWVACYENRSIHAHGATPLEAAMRCFVLNKLGMEIDVPEALMLKEHKKTSSPKF